MISIITPVYKGSQYFTALENMISQNVKILHSKYPDVLVEFIIDKIGNGFRRADAAFHRR